MNPINFKHSNKTLLKPENMTEEECDSLHVYVDGTSCLSCWQMNWKERLSALFFGKAWLWVWGSQTQPPVAIQIEYNPFREIENVKVNNG